MLRTRAGFGHPEDTHFQCTRCALCCGDTKNRTRHILLLKKDAQTISTATSKPVDSFAREVKGHEPYIYEMKKREDGKCVHLKGTDCKVYELRPLVCRFYPFELLTMRDGKQRFFYTEECPGIGKGKKLGRNHFEKLFKRACEQLRKTEGT